MIALLDTTPLISLIVSLSAAIASVIGFIGVTIMAFGALKGIMFFIIYTIRRYDFLIEIRINIAKHLSLGLEFLIAKDIIETIVRPTLNELLILAILIAIRTAISYILLWELKEANEEIIEEREFEQAIEEYEGASKKRKARHSNR